MTRTDLDVGHLLEIAAHDLRGPLSVLAGYTAMLEQQLGSGLTESQREMIAAIQRSTGRVKRAADALTALANLEQGAVSPTRVETSVAEWITPVAAIVARPFTFEASESAEARVVLDPVLMQVALEALLDELDDGQSSGEPVVAAVPASGFADRVQLQVGRRAVANVAERADQAGCSSGARGTLGGLLAARIVEAHGGRFERTADDVFVIDLPTVAPRL